MIKQAPSKLLVALVLCAFAASHGFAQSEDEAEQLALKISPEKSRLDVEQIVVPQSSGGTDDFQIEATPAENERRSEVGQLPGDLEVPDGEGKSPESAISKPIQSPEAALFGRVAEAWQVIRERGQQPTPELIAREIGPDQLATFLDQNPDATDIFGQDSDTLPVDVPGVEQLPDGGIFLIPPQGGG